MTISGDEPITYIASIVPGTVLAVKAYKQLTGERRLVDVPTDLYTVTTQTYGSVTAVQIVVNKPLSTITDQGWSDDLYVTFQSSVGPDIVDILKYLIADYTDLDLGYHVVRSRSGEAPSRSRPTSRSWSGRTSIAGLAGDRLPGPLRHRGSSNGVFYLKYLPEEPTPADDHHRQRHRRRAGHRSGVDPHGRHRDEDEGQVAAELGRRSRIGRRTPTRRRSSCGTTSPSTAPRSRTTTSTSTTSRTSCTSARRSG